MDVFLMIFTDSKESSTIFELRRTAEGILKQLPEEQRLYKDDQQLPEEQWLYEDDQLLDGKTLGECGFTGQPQAPATVGLAFRADDAFEALCLEPFSALQSFQM